MTIKTYLLSLPERLLRSGLGLGAGVAREVGEVALPDGVKRSRLYQNLVDTTLRFLIEQVGGVEGAYAAEDPLPDDFLKRRTAGNVVEALGLVAFRASPVWVLAALADVCGMGRQLIPEIADALEGPGTPREGHDSSRASIRYSTGSSELRQGSRPRSTHRRSMSPSLREEWQAIREESRSLQTHALPSRETLTGMWGQLRDEAARQERSVFETSTDARRCPPRRRCQTAPGGCPRRRWLARRARVRSWRPRCSITIERRSRRSSRLATRRSLHGSSVRTCGRQSASSRPSIAR